MPRETCNRGPTMQQIIADGSWLPYVFAFLMGLSVLVYTTLDGMTLVWAC